MEVNVAEREVVVVAAAVEMMEVEVGMRVEGKEAGEGEMEAFHEAVEENPLEKEVAQLQWLQSVSPPLLQSYRHTMVLQLLADKKLLPFHAHHCQPLKHSEVYHSNYHTKVLHLLADKKHRPFHAHH